MKYNKILSWMVRGLGVCFMLAGILSAIMGPVETITYYWFSEGGRFYIDGFGFGSLVFASITWQIIGYYCIAIVCIILGIGHLNRKSWARTLALAGLRAWAVTGVPLVLVTFSLLLSFKELGIGGVVLSVAAALFLYPGVPVLLNRFYQHPDVCTIFGQPAAAPQGIDAIPVPVLSLTMLLFFDWLVMHVPLFFNGIIPLFGSLYSGMPGIVLITIVLMCLAGLVWGMVRMKTWAWWGACLLLAAAVISTTVTLLPLSFQDIVAVANLPKLEAEALQGVPLKGGHLALFVSLPMLGTLVLLLASRRYFKAKQLDYGIIK